MGTLKKTATELQIYSANPVGSEYFDDYTPFRFYTTIETLNNQPSERTCISWSEATSLLADHLLYYVGDSCVHRPVPYSHVGYPKGGRYADVYGDYRGMWIDLDPVKNYTAYSDATSIYLR